MTVNGTGPKNVIEKEDVSKTIQYVLYRSLYLLLRSLYREQATRHRNTHSTVHPPQPKWYTTLKQAKKSRSETKGSLCLGSVRLYDRGGGIGTGIWTFAISFGDARTTTSYGPWAIPSESTIEYKLPLGITSYYRNKNRSDMLLIKRSSYSDCRIEEEIRRGVCDKRSDELRVSRRDLILSSRRSDHRRKASKRIQRLNLYDGRYYLFSSFLSSFFSPLTCWSYMIAVTGSMTSTAAWIDWCIDDCT